MQMVNMVLFTFKLSLVLSVQETTHFTAVAAYCLMLGHVCVSELNK